MLNLITIYFLLAVVSYSGLSFKLVGTAFPGVLAGIVLFVLMYVVFPMEGDRTSVGTLPPKTAINWIGQIIYFLGVLIGGLLALAFWIGDPKALVVSLILFAFFFFRALVV